MTSSDPSPGAAEAEARRALDAYPTPVAAGVVFTCLEEVDRRWRILATDSDSPQQARDELAHLLLLFASESDEEAVAEKLRAGADLLDRERHDDLTVVGRRFRIGRIEKLARVGLEGPEPPRSSDPETPSDPEKPSDPETTPGVGRAAPSRSLGFIADNAMRGTAAAITRYELHSKVPESTTAEEHRDAARAVQTRQELVLQAAEFIVAEETDGRWRPHVTGSDATPQAARGLTDYFRVVIPGPDRTTTTLRPRPVPPTRSATSRPRRPRLRRVLR